MKRPEIKDFMPDETLNEVHKKFRNSPELYSYICALDAYIDYLEGEKPDSVPEKRYFENDYPITLD